MISIPCSSPITESIPQRGQRAVPSFLSSTHSSISADPLATTVKCADLRHNMDLSRFDEVTDRDRERVEKYRTALTLLE